VTIGKWRPPREVQGKPHARSDIGDEWEVYVYIAGEETDPLVGGSFSDNKSKLMIVGNDPSSLFGLMMLLHETGHVEKEKTMTEVSFKESSEARWRTKIGDGTELDKAIVINDERAATAYSLSAMKEILGPLARLDDIRKAQFKILHAYHKAFSQ
jgi:hypothetical protein